MTAINKSTQASKLHNQLSLEKPKDSTREDKIVRFFEKLFSTGKKHSPAEQAVRDRAALAQIRH